MSSPTITASVTLSPGGPSATLYTPAAGVWVVEATITTAIAAGQPTAPYELSISDGVTTLTRNYPATPTDGSAGLVTDPLYFLPDGSPTANRAPSSNMLTFTAGAPIVATATGLVGASVAVSMSASAGPAGAIFAGGDEGAPPWPWGTLWQGANGAVAIVPAPSDAASFVALLTKPMATTVDPFVQPVAGAAVTVRLSATAWLVAPGTISIARAGAFTVTSIAGDGAHATIVPLDQLPNSAAPGTTIAPGAVATFSSPFDVSLANVAAIAATIPSITTANVVQVGSKP